MVRPMQGFPKPLPSCPSAGPPPSWSIPMEATSGSVVRRQPALPVWGQTCPRSQLVQTEERCRGTGSGTWWARRTLSTFPPRFAQSRESSSDVHAWYLPKNTPSFRNCGSSAGSGLRGGEAGGEEAEWGSGGGAGWRSGPWPRRSSVHWHLQQCSEAPRPLSLLPPIRSCPGPPLPRSPLRVVPRRRSAPAPPGLARLRGPCSHCRSLHYCPALCAEPSFSSRHPVLPMLGTEAPMVWGGPRAGGLVGNPSQPNGSHGGEGRQTLQLENRSRKCFRARKVGAGRGTVGDRPRPQPHAGRGVLAPRPALR